MMYYILHVGRPDDPANLVVCNGYLIILCILKIPFVYSVYLHGHFLNMYFLNKV